MTHQALPLVRFGPLTLCLTSWPVKQLHGYGSNRMLCCLQGWQSCTYPGSSCTHAQNAGLLPVLLLLLPSCLYMLVLQLYSIQWFCCSHFIAVDALGKSLFPCTCGWHMVSLLSNPTLLFKLVLLLVSNPVTNPVIDEQLAPVLFVSQPPPSSACSTNARGSLHSIKHCRIMYAYGTEPCI